MLHCVAKVHNFLGCTMVSNLADSYFLYRGVMMPILLQYLFSYLLT